MRAGLFILVIAACGSKKPPEAPKQDDRVAVLEAALAKTKGELQQERDAAEKLRASDSSKADENKALQDKLAAAIGQAGEVTTADGAVKLELVDQILFPVGQAELTDKGKEVLGKVGEALKDVDKQVWVQGHTDDQPIFVKKEAPKPAAPARPVRGRQPPPKKEPTKAEKPDAVLAFTTNWELSAARALTVVHYLQDDAKIDPTRLAAVAFSQYRPVSKVKAKNRRIEIVLYPRVAITPK